MTAATVSHAIFGGWTGVTDADQPVIGWQVMADRKEQFAYLADWNAAREPTGAESAAYAERHANPASEMERALDAQAATYERELDRLRERSADLERELADCRASLTEVPS